ncbi:MAG TPA: hypothetical protein VFZ83_11985 [Acidimicrobiia bacterium]|nr:hypothetical protein [Acidimicrobiia bacterium]
MRFSVDPWDPGYGASLDVDLVPSAVVPVVDVEVPTSEWGPRQPAADTVVPPAVVFVDGVRRLDARSWISAPDGSETQPGLFASYAAGSVRCDTVATVASVVVGRCVVSPSRALGTVTTGHARYDAIGVADAQPETLNRAIQDAMSAIEIRVAEAARAEGDELVVVDGPLRRRDHLPHTIGLVKSHNVRYLPDDLDPVVGRLGVGERTPVFLVPAAFSRYSWYLRLPGPADSPWAGIVRCEASARSSPAEVVALADVVAATLPRFASEPHKDARAPQNLYPIGGLERELRRRLGDAALLYRALRVAAAAAR